MALDTKKAKEIGSKGGKRSKRGPDTTESLVKRIKIVAENEGKEVTIKVRVIK